MQRHLAMLNGLILLYELRLTELDAVQRELGDLPIENESRWQVKPVLAKLKAEFMPGHTKARMLFDEFSEIDLYVAGPLDLFFCLADAMVDRYKLLAREEPALCHQGLERYLSANRPAFDAVHNLRDWVIHPGYSRQPQKAESEFWNDRGELVADHPYAIAARLLQLFGEVVNKLNESTRRN